MERSWLYRILLYLGITVAACVALTPSVATWMGKEDKLPGWFRKEFTRKISLGLDLQGGLHMVYKVDVEKAVGHKADRLASDLEDRLAKERKISGANVTISRTGEDEIVVQFKNPEDAKKLNRDLLKPFRNELFEDSREAKNGIVRLKINADVVDNLRESALHQGKETIDNRVNKLGVAEPTVLTKGTDIIVELPGLKPEEFERVKRLIGKTAQLEFKIDDDGSE